MDSKKLSRLLDGLCNDALTPAEERELSDVLSANTEARQAYYDHLDVHLSMVDHALASGPLADGPLPKQAGTTGARAQDLQGNNPSSGEAPPSARLASGAAAAGAPQVSARADRLHVGLSQRQAFKLCVGLAASLLVGAGVFLGSWPSDALVRDGSAVAAASSPRDADESREVEATGETSFFLAQITDVASGTKWNTPASTDFLLRLSRGDRIDLEKGSVQIDYFAGASLVLEGPCSYVVTGEESGRLQSGSLTGNVTIGEFLLTTPTARVLDLGTEFGVAVDSVDRTQVSVFNGEVEVTAEHGSHEASLPLRLRQGGSASVARGGRIVEMAEADTTRYLRRLPNSPMIAEAITEVSLVDVLAAKHDASINLTAVIAPDTGQPDRHPWLRSDGPGYSMSHGYQTASWHRFVDGVFIPPREGGPTVIDSLGTAVDLPASTGRTWGPIWSRRSAASSVPAEGQEDYWGTDTLEGVAERSATCKYGMIGLHSNVGATFDLRQLATVCGGVPARFSGQVSNLDNSLARLPEWAGDKSFTAEFRVYVDGQPRETLRALGREAGDVSFAVALQPGDRFLTVIATDDGERDENGESITDYADAYDHLVLIDPLISLVP